MARGDLQSENTYGDTDTSLLNMESLRLFLIMALEKGMHIYRTMDINHAFLYAPIEEELFIEHPKNRGMVKPLRRALYGLKQSPKNWNDTLRQFMNKNGYLDSFCSPGFYVQEDPNSMVAAYVDDTMIAGYEEDKIDEVIDMFEKEFELKIIGEMKNNILSTDVLGLDLDYDLDRGEATLSLESYIDRMIVDYPEFKNSKEQTPHKSKYVFHPKKTPVDIKDESEKQEQIHYLQKILGKI